MKCCVKCGSQIDDEDNFCCKCGAKQDTNQNVAYDIDNFNHNRESQQEYFGKKVSSLRAAIII